MELAEEFFINGGELLVVDEIHKYKAGTSDWSKEVKEIYELFPKLKMIVSGSSLLKLKEGDADLSRRAIKYTMPGLSFREALRFYHGLEFPKWTLEDILSHPLDLWDMVASKCKPIAYFKEYLEKGYYPFLLEGEDDYFIRIEQVINYIIETELPQICKVDVANIRKVQALIKLIAEEVPFELNANKLAGSLEIGRDTVVEYLKYLGDAKVLNLLYSDKKKRGKLAKPDKVYMENPNILYALAPDKADIGTVRESFAVNSLSESHLVEYGKIQGDFKVDSRYTLRLSGLLRICIGVASRLHPVFDDAGEGFDVELLSREGLREGKAAFLCGGARSGFWRLHACGLFRKGKEFEAEGRGLFEQETDACSCPGVGAEGEEFTVFDASCADSFHK